MHCEQCTLEKQCTANHVINCELVCNIYSIHLETHTYYKKFRYWERWLIYLHHQQSEFNDKTLKWTFLLAVSRWLKWNMFHAILSIYPNKVARCIPSNAPVSGHFLMRLGTNATWWPIICRRWLEQGTLFIIRYVVGNKVSVPPALP